MKWIMLAPMSVFLTACGCCTNTDVMEYRQINVRPVIAVPIYKPVTIMRVAPVPVKVKVKVITTTVEYY